MAMVIDDVKLVSDKTTITQPGFQITQEWRVLFSGGTWSSFTCYGLAHAAGLPIYGDVYGATTIYVNQIAMELESGSLATPGSGQQGKAKYTVQYVSRQPGRLDLSPLSRPPIIRWGGSDIKEVRKKDTTGAPLVNAAGDYYHDLPEFFIPGGSVTITYNVADNPGTTICVPYSNTVNDSDWHGVSAGNGKTGIITAAETTENYQGSDITYWVLSLPLDFRRDSWTFKPINYGYRFLDGAGKKVTYLDKAGCPAPVFLDSSGLKLPDGDDPIIFPSAGYELLDQTDWTAAGFPNPF